MEEMEELCAGCIWTLVERNGVKGYLVTGIKTGESIFLPLAGAIFWDGNDIAGFEGDYWSSSLGDPTTNLFADERNAVVMVLGYDGTVKLFDWARCYGRSIRAVCDKD